MTRRAPALVALGILLAAPFNWAVGQEFVVPKDGTFYIERTPAFAFKATLADEWKHPDTGKGKLNVFAPVPPELPGQKRLTVRLSAPGNEDLKAQPVTDLTFKRPMLGLLARDGELSPQAGVRLRVEYEGTLLAASLKRGKPSAVPELTKAERQQYLASTTSTDHADPGFRRWMDEKGLTRRTGEDAMQFGHRVFTYLVKNGKYRGDVPDTESHRPSRACQTLNNDCGGFSLLHVAVMRANDIPARSLFGRWAVQPTDDNGQYHVTAEFFVEGSGWVPVDIAGTIYHKPKNPNAMFGNTDGQFFTMHVDTDLEPVKALNYAWAQGVMFQWTGPGDFWKGHTVKSKWTVERKPIKK